MLTAVVQQVLWQSLLDFWRHAPAADFAPGKVIDLSRWAKLWGSFPILERTKRRLYVREEYDRMYRRLVAASKSTKPECPGVVITGQPGIGESTSARKSRSTHIVPRKVMFRYLRPTSAHSGWRRRHLCARSEETCPLPRQCRLLH